jgi:hypothetical protein
MGAYLAGDAAHTERGVRVVFFNDLYRLENQQVARRLAGGGLHHW